MVSNKFITAWWLSSNNVGDGLNYSLLSYISGKDVVLATDRTKQHYLCCGTILGEYDKGSEVWGAGFWDAHQKVHIDIPIHAVRGELTRNEVGKDCVVGDPALLLPKLGVVYPNLKYTLFKHGIGVIPHWSNVAQAHEKFGESVTIINPFMSLMDFVGEIMSCEYIFSESLHGLIIADAYNVPNKWLSIGNNPPIHTFKYHDYYSTTEAQAPKPITELDTTQCTVNKYKHSLEELLNSCPFYGLDK